MIFQYTGPSQISRRVVEELGVYTVTDEVEGPFPSQLVVPNADEAVLDSASPRDAAPWKLRWRGGFQAPSGASPVPGDRILYRGTEYEVTSPPRHIHEGKTMIESYEVKCQPVFDLYPLEGTLQEMDGTLVGAHILFSLFRGAETHSDTGSYEEYSAEAPLEWQAGITMNRQIARGLFVYKIVAPEVNPQGRYIRMNLRRSGG
jgi:hypothetical protein